MNQTLTLKGCRIYGERGWAAVGSAPSYLSKNQQIVIEGGSLGGSFYAGFYLDSGGKWTVSNMDINPEAAAPEAGWVVQVKSVWRVFPYEIDFSNLNLGPNVQILP